MRMKSAFEIIVNAGGGKPPVDLPPELQEAAARLLPPPSSSKKKKKTKKSPSAKSNTTSSSYSQSGGPSPIDSSSPQEGSSVPFTSSHLPFDFASSSSSSSHLPIPHRSLQSIPELHSTPPTGSTTSPSSYPFISPGLRPPSPAFNVFPGSHNHLHSSSSYGNPHLQYPLSPSLPPFPAQFADLGPSSRSSPSLARLFAMKSPDDDDRAGSGTRDLDLYRQDPIHLGYLTEEISRELFEL